MWKCPVCGVLNEDHEPLCSNCFSERKTPAAPHTSMPQPTVPPTQPVPPPVRPAAPPVRPSTPAYVPSPMPPAPPRREKKAWPLVLAMIVVVFILIGLIALLVLQRANNNSNTTPRTTVSRTVKTTRPAATKTPSPKPKPTNTPTPTKASISTARLGDNTVYVNGKNVTRVKFTASSAGTYIFTTSGSKDTYGYLYSSATSGTALAQNDDGGSGSNFKIEYQMSANQTVYVGVQFYSASDTGNVTLNISRKAENSRTFELNSTVTSNRGQVTVRWTDSANKAPYTVSYQYVGNSGITQPKYWAGTDKAASTTNATSYRIDQLIPGKTYKIYIEDRDGVSISRTYTLPMPSTFSDDKLQASAIKLTLAPRKKNDSAADSTATAINSLSASQIVADRGKSEYGVRFDVDYPSLARSRTYLTQIAIIAPNGYTECEVWSDVTYDMQYTGKYWYMLADWSFSMIYDKNKEVPSGTWTVELYWDGMYVNKATFQVGK